MLILTDRAEIKGSARITRDGYLVADALVGKANNIQEYRAAELGLTDRQPDEIVRVFRPESVVFDAKALATLAHRPITLDHPAEAVTAENWKRFAVGDVGDEVIRDGERIRVPIKVMDADAVDSIAKDRQEFSLGYAATLDFTAGDHDGQAYDAALASVSYNHLAACRNARGGAELRIVDEREPDRRKPQPGQPLLSEPTKLGDGKMPHTLIIDGLQVPNVSDEARAAIEKLQGQLRDAAAAKAEAETQVATLTTDKATLDAKVTTLEKQVADAKLTPQQLRDAAKAYQGVVDQAKALGVTVTDDMDEPSIMKAVVASRVGDAAKDWNDVQIAASFATLAKDTKAAPVADSVRTVIASGVASIQDGRAIRDAARVSRYAPAA